MSAWTTAHLYRPGEPPPITTGGLADFIQGVISLGILHGDNGLSASHLRFGRAIDQDEKPIQLDPPEDAVVYPMIREIKWDVHLRDIPLTRVIEMLREPLKARGILARPKIDQRIYRAFIFVGYLREDITAQLTRDASEEHRAAGLSLYDLSITIEPIMIFDQEQETNYFVGWISIDLGGQGYLFPWTHEELRARLNACEALQRLRELCRSRWPVPPVEVTPEIIEARRQSGELWAGDDCTAPPDWRWGINQSY